jgi:hypothetical protein
MGKPSGDIKKMLPEQQHTQLHVSIHSTTPPGPLL